MRTRIAHAHVYDRHWARPHRLSLSVGSDTGKTRNLLMHRFLTATIVAVGLAGSPGTAAAEGDAGNGEKLFKRCAVCHTAADGAANKIGPNLFGVFGSTAGSRATGFNYSPALAASGIVWTEQTLDVWLARPRDLVAKTRMSFPGFKEPTERADVIAYLKTLAP
jgi:cytochrome c